MTVAELEDAEPSRASNVFEGVLLGLRAVDAALMLAAVAVWIDRELILSFERPNEADAAGCL